MELKFHHLGLATRHPQDSINVLAALGYRLARNLIVDPLQKVELALCTHAGMPDIEIISPVHHEGPISRMLQDQSENLYHQCYATEDRKAALAKLKALGIKTLTVSAPLPAVLFNNKTVSFHYIKGIGLIEILEASP